VDTTVPGAKFDVDGVCNFCHLHSKLEQQFPLSAAGEARKQSWLDEIRKKGRGKEFDCVLGVSGGRDSMYTLWLAVKEWGLRPLAVHFNDGFGNPTAGENMYKAAAKLGVTLRTVTYRSVISNRRHRSAFMELPRWEIPVRNSSEVWDRPS
jgi:3'-phosphoadenosine 5'-phosphosulfate sulfotransferase (PAPS reductase)/FAD synthetase